MAKTEFSAAITPVISVTWSFRNHYNILICCLRNISYYYQCWKQLCCLIFLWNPDTLPFKCFLVLYSPFFFLEIPKRERVFEKWIILNYQCLSPRISTYLHYFWYVFFCYEVCQVWKTSFRHIFRFVHLQSVKGFSRVERSHSSHLKDDHFKVVPLEQMGMVGLQMLHLAALSIQALPHLLHIEASLARALQQLGHAVGCGHVVLGEPGHITLHHPHRPLQLNLLLLHLLLVLLHWLDHHHQLVEQSHHRDGADLAARGRGASRGLGAQAGKGVGGGRGHRAGTEARNEEILTILSIWSWWCRGAFLPG